MAVLIQQNVTTFLKEVISSLLAPTHTMTITMHLGQPKEL